VIVIFRTAKNNFAAGSDSACSKRGWWALVFKYEKIIRVKQIERTIPQCRAFDMSNKYTYLLTYLFTTVQLRMWLSRERLTWIKLLTFVLNYQQKINEINPLIKLFIYLFCIYLFNYLFITHYPSRSWNSVSGSCHRTKHFDTYSNCDVKHGQLNVKQRNIQYSKRESHST